MARPNWAANASDYRDPDDEPDESELTQLLRAAASGRAKPETKQRLTITQWLAAFEQYAFAASATGQITYGALKTHVNTCLRAAEMDTRHGMKMALAIEYDKLTRKEWARKSSMNVPDFNIRASTAIINSEILALAKQNTEHEGGRKGKGKGKDGNDKGKGGVPPANDRATCTYCGTPGHSVDVCYAKHGRPEGAKGGKKGGKDNKRRMAAGAVKWFPANKQRRQ